MVYGNALVYDVIIVVKLNNPLMGTETHLHTLFGMYKLVNVKLNNPLMGTETLDILNNNAHARNILLN